MAWLIRRALRTGFRRGMQGSKAWLTVGLTAGAITVLKRVFGEAEETVYEEELKPGQGIEIRTVRRG
jgi:hypothetical protein